jgi:hypothetical protein
MIYVLEFESYSTEGILIKSPTQVQKILLHGVYLEQNILSIIKSYLIV